MFVRSFLLKFPIDFHWPSFYPPDLGELAFMLSALLYELLKWMFPKVNFNHLLLKFLGALVVLGLLLRAYDWLFAPAN